MLNDPVSAGGGMRGRLRERYESGGVEALYAELVTDDAAVEANLAEARLVRDERLRDFMAGVGDPLAEGWRAPRAEAPSPEALTVEQAELELDAMHVLSRTERMLMIRHDQARAEVRRLNAEVDRLRKRAKPGNASQRRPPLRRLRMAIGRALGR
jgi:hypothetical protein